MNIFVLHTHPAKAAEMACDKHIVKMPLETAQMLCTVARSFGAEDSFLYKPAHPKHPCTLWAAKNVSNWKWLCQHGIALCHEYTYRYGREHKSESVIRKIYREGLGPKGISLFTNQTPFAQAMPEQYKDKNPVLAYRNYYLGEKHAFARWTRRSPPLWWTNSSRLSR